jgi:hypothetical protein
MDLGPHPPPASVRAALLGGVLVAVVALLATLPAVGGGYVYDDQYYLVENPAVSGDGWVSTSRPCGGRSPSRAGGCSGARARPPRAG